MTEIVAEYESPEAAQVLERLRVLVIDGRDITRRALGLILGAAGADVTGAESLAEAQAHLAVRRHDDGDRQRDRSRPHLPLARRPRPHAAGRPSGLD